MKLTPEERRHVDRIIEMIWHRDRDRMNAIIARLEGTPPARTADHGEVKFEVLIREVSSGRQVVVKEDWRQHHGHHGLLTEHGGSRCEDCIAAIIFYWSEGNFGCDCNRQLAFFRELEGHADPNECACGSERYRVQMRIPGDTKLFYDEVSKTPS